MNRLSALFANLRDHRWLPGLLALAAAAIYAVQAFTYIHTLPSTLDEGNYLYKGLLFARGVYRPFQDYGPWTNKMPLAFLIPGWGQALFGAGLRSGRVQAVVLSLLMLLGLYLVVRRVGGRWWAAGSVLALALTPGVIQIYSQALSEGLVAFLLVWVLVLVIGPGRPLWQLLAGSVLAALVVMTRQNMLPLVPFVVLYIGWEYGWKKGLNSAVASGLVLLAFHVSYWPAIMRLWTPWLPFKLPIQTNIGPGALASLFPATAGSLAPVAAPVVESFSLTSLYQDICEFLSSLYPFWDALRYYFVPVFGVIVSWLLASRRRVDWRSDSNFRTAVSLSILLLILVVSHLWAALGNDYCVYCFSIYLSFFSAIGFVILAASASAWRLRLPLPENLLAGLMTLLYAAGAGLGAYQVLDDVILTVQIPRVSGGRILPGATDLWRSLSNKFGLSFEALQRPLPTLAGLVVGVLLLLAAFLLARVLARRGGQARSAGALALLLFLALGALLSPTDLFGNANAVDCGGDVLSTYEAAGQALRDEIPAGSLVYWAGGLSPVPLLYISDVRIFPPQLNGGYNFSATTNSDRAFQRGMWNAELKAQWLDEAQYVLVEDRTYRGSMKQNLDPQKYNELLSTPALVTCREGSKIRVFRREK